MALALVRAGWELVGRNRRHIGFELDIIARKGATLIVVEVKARRRAPRVAADLLTMLPRRKCMALRRGAERVAGQVPGVQTVRVDLAVVYPTKNGGWGMRYFVQAV